MDLSNIIIICIGGYLFLLIVLGLVAAKKRASQSLKDFYLAGSGLGPFVLLLTLYATQYSANTMLVVPAEVVNKGMGMILVLGYMTAIVVFYLTFAPKLFTISRRHDFITPGDWLDFRFKRPGLTLVANLVFVVVSLNFLLAQLMAMGHITNSITGGQIPYWAGVAFLAGVVIVYETLGGMRAVAWTDVLQGTMLLLGLIGIFLIVVPGPGHLKEISTWLIEHEPEKIRVPDLDFRIYWASTVLMIGMAAAIYPQAIQRVYAAKSVGALKKSLSFMVFMPLFTIMILFLMGMISIPHYAGMEGVERDQVLPEMLYLWAQQSTLALGLTVMVIVGLLAAIMSTADSVLLTLSSIIAKDIFGKTLLKDAEEEQVTRSGKIISWVLMIVISLVALDPGITLWGLIELKMQILVQLAPLFILGVHFPNLNGRAMMGGLIAGLFFSLATFFLGHNTIGGIQAGLIGLGLNVLVCILIQKMLGRQGDEVTG